MAHWAAGCPVCGSSNRAYLCPECVGSQILQARSQSLQAGLEQLRAQHGSLLQQLDAELVRREAVQQQLVRKWHQQQELKAALARAQHAQQQLAQAKAQLADLQASNGARRAMLEQLRSQAGVVRAEVLGNRLPTILRYQALTASHVAAMLEREQRLRLRQLTEVLPLRINAVRSSGGPCQITVANLRLPQSGSTPVGGWPEPESTSAALGYLLLLVDHVGVIMGGPMLHESHHQGSTSSIWQPPSFWSRQPRSAAAMLPLDVLSAVGSAATPAGQAAYSSTANRYLTSATFWGLPTRSDSGGLGPASLANAASAATTFAASAAAAAFTRATGFEAPGFYTPGTSPSAGAGAAATAAAGGAGSSGTGGSSGNVPEASAARRRGSSSGGGDRGGSSGGSGSSGSGRQSDFKAAWDLLQRSLACFLKDKAASNGMQLPSAWNPLAWLVVYCAVVKRDMRQDGKLVALSSRVDAAAAAAAAATAAAGQGSLEGGAAAEVGGGGGSRGGAAAATAQQDDGRLPPPPPAAEGGGGGGGLAPDAAGTGTGLPLLWDDADEEDEGWVVQTMTPLPPPPSQPDDVQHWARAMFADGNALAGAAPGSGSYPAGAAQLHSSSPYQQPQQQQVALGSSPAGAGGMLSIERVRSVFGK